MCLTVKGCCCMSLRKAGIAHGWVEMAVLFFLIIISIIRINDHFPNERSRESYDFASTSLNHELIRLSIYVFYVLTSGLLLLGIKKNNHLMLLPWLVLRGIGLIIAVPVGLLTIIFSSFTFSAGIIMDSIFFFIIIGLFLWSWIVIYSLYEKIRKKRNRPLPNSEA